MKRTAIVVLVLGIALWAAGCGGKGDGDGNRNGNGAANGGPGDGSGFDEVGNEKLTESEIKTYLDVWPGVAKRMSEIAHSGSPAAGLAWGTTVQAYIRSKGLSSEEFGRIHTNVIQASLAMNWKDRLAEAEAKGSPPQVLSMFRAQAEAFKDVPEENVELLRKYDAEFKAIGKSMRERAESDRE